MGLNLLGLCLTVLLTLGSPDFALAGRESELSGQIIFVAGSAEERSIMAVEARAGQTRLLADRPGPDTQPAVGPQGQLAWINQNQDNWDLIENGRPVSVGLGMHLTPAYSPEGRLAAALSDDNETSLYFFDKAEREAFLRLNGALAISPAWSPDGRSLAFVSNMNGIGQIYVKRGDGLPLPISAEPVRNTDPAWSPDGQFLVFVIDETDICTARPDGRDWTCLTRNQGVNRHPSFSPDGQMLVFSSNRNGPEQLFIMDRQGGQQRPLLPNFPKAQALPVWTDKLLQPVIQ